MAIIICIVCLILFYNLSKSSNPTDKKIAIVVLVIGLLCAGLVDSLYY